MHGKMFTFLQSLLLMTALGCSTAKKAPHHHDHPTVGALVREVGRIPASANVVDLEAPLRRIVILKSDVANPNGVASELARKFAATKGHVYKHAIKGFAISLPDAAVAQLKNDKRVRYIINDTPVKASAQTIPVGISRVGADQNATAAIDGNGGNVNVDVAVIDTGVDLDHPDINVYRSVNFAKGSSADDGNGHGTHVAGTIAAKDDSNQVVGVAPGARIWGVRVLDNRGSGWTSDIVAGIDYVRANAAEIDVVNMSLGGAGSDDGNCGLSNNDPQHEAICNAVNAGVVFVVAAGNETADSKNSTPAAYDEVITVSAIVDSDGLPGGDGPSTARGADDTLASFSNFGADVDLAAPGVDILSTWKGGGLNTISGTSMASPHVAGGAALYVAKFGKPTDAAGVAAVRAALISHAWPQGSSEGFTGDSDGIAEPLMWLSSFDPSAPPAPGVRLSLATDKSAYNTTQGDTQSHVTAVVRDETNQPISGLADVSFVKTLNGQPVALTLVEGATGSYDGDIDLGALADGNYTLAVSVTDARALTGSSSTNFSLSSVAIPVMYVSGISYANSNKNLLITVAIKDTNGAAVSSASVTVQVYRDTTYVGQGTSSTSSAGTVTFNLRNAAAGCYHTDVANVVKSGLTYDSTRNAVDAGHCR